MKNEDSTTWIRLKKPITGTKLKEISDSDGTFHVEIELDLEEMIESYGGIECFIEDKILKDAADIKDLDFYPYKVESNKVIIRVTGEVIVVKSFHVRIVYDYKVIEEERDIYAETESEAMEIAKKHFYNLENAGKEVKFIKAEIIED